MRRIASLRLTLTLSTLVLSTLPLAGCGFQTWSEPPFTTGTNPNQPRGASENMERVMGKTVQPTTLTTEPGDIWPGPLPPALTLQDLEKNGTLTPGTEQPVPGSPDARQDMSSQHSVPARQPAPVRGSSMPPGSTQPGLNTGAAPSSGAPTATVAPPTGAAGAGQVYQTPRGAAVTTGGGTGYQTTVTPGGGSAIVVPNGNGTSTIIHSDGRIETVTTPK